MDTKSKYILDLAQKYRKEIDESFRDILSESIYTNAFQISQYVVNQDKKYKKIDWDTRIDRIVTSRKYGFPIMFLLLALLLWITIIGANYPSAFLSEILVKNGHPLLKNLAQTLYLPQWLSGILFDGIYLTTAWVVSVMLPPMAIFFPIFTLLEDFGYLPRVAFNLDNLFRKAGTHGKQALTMSMGFGCNASGIIATRIIDSPRERLVAIITNNFSLCNGRWPTQILLATLFIGTLVPSYLSGFISIMMVITIAVLGIGLMFVTSFFLSKTLLKGKASSFYLELPPYRPPHFWQTIYTSLFDRTLVVLWRAVVFAAPAGAIIWFICNISINDSSLAQYLILFFDDFGLFFGLNGIIILAYIIAVPANEIVIPTILMLIVLITGTSGINAETGVLLELDSDQQIGTLLRNSGWTLLTAINVMIFSLLHNPCSTTIYTIYKETKSVKWTLISTILPICLGLLFLFITTTIWKIIS